MKAKTTKLIGLYKSEDGRERLRAAFLQLLARHIGLRKVATIVADRDQFNQNDEDDRTRSALRRWGLQGQEVLWFKDESKSARVLARLESLLLSYSDVQATLVSDQEAGRRRTLSAGLQAFFGASFAGSEAEPPIPEGLYTERRGVRGLWDDDAWQMEFKTSLYRLDATRTCYLTDFVTYTQEGSAPPVIRRHLTGFTHFTERGDLFRFLTDPEVPSRRRIDSMRRVQWHQDFLPMAPRKEPVFVTRQDEIWEQDTEGWNAEAFAKDRGMLSITALDLRDDEAARLVMTAILSETDDGRAV